MSTMLLRGSGPDKRSEMSESNSADHGDRRADSAPPCPPWREGGKRLAWLPAVASLLVFLIGLSDILTVFKPDGRQPAAQAQAVRARLPGQRHPHLRRHRRPAAHTARARAAAAQAPGLAGGPGAARLRHRHPLPALPAPAPRDLDLGLLDRGDRAAGRAALLPPRVLRDRRSAHPVERAERVRGPGRGGRRDRPRLPLGRAAGRELLVLPAAPGRRLRTRRRLRPGRSGRRTPAATSTTC